MDKDNLLGLLILVAIFVVCIFGYIGVFGAVSRIIFVILGGQ